MISILLLAALSQAPSFVGMPPDSVTTQNQTYWVDGAAGSDGYDCLFPNKPCKTIQGAANKIPKNLYHDVQVQVAAGTYAGAVFEGFTSRLPANVVTSYAGLRIQGTLGSPTLTSGTTSGTLTGYTAKSNATMPILTDSTQSWTVNELRGHFVQITGGTGFPGTASAPPIYPIISNTATTLTITSFTAQAVGSTYQIVTPTTVINSFGTLAPATGTPMATPIAAGALQFINCRGASFAVSRIRITPNATMTRGFVVGGGRVNFANVKCDIGTGGLFCFSAALGEPTGRTQFLSSAFTASAGNTFIAISGGTNASGSMQLSGNMFYVSAGSVFGVIAGPYNVLTGSANSFFGLRTALLLDGSNYNQFVDTNIDCNNVASSTGIEARASISNGGNGGAWAQSNSQMIINNCAVAAMRCEGNVHALIGANTTGTGNAVGIQMLYGAKMRIPASVTLTGTVEVQLDGTGTTLATMRAASPKLINNAYGTLIYE